MDSPHPPPYDILAKRPAKIRPPNPLVKSTFSQPKKKHMPYHG